MAVSLLVLLVGSTTHAANLAASRPSYYTAGNPAKLLKALRASDGWQAWPALMKISELPPGNLPILKACLNHAPLSPTQRGELSWAIGHIQERSVARAKLDRFRHWILDAFIGGYHKVGDHNLQWDKPAEQAIKIYATGIGEWRGKAFYSSTIYQLQMACRKAIHLGCRDPLVAFLRDWLWQQRLGPMSLALRAERTQAALEHLLTSRYSPAVRFIATFSQCAALAYHSVLLKAGSGDPFQTNPMLTDLRQLLRRLLPQVAALRNVPPQIYQ